MNSNEEPAKLESYVLTCDETDFENQKVLQYGISQTYIDSDGNQTTTQIDSISDKEDFVKELIKYLERQDVYPCTLEYVVEDYVNEFYSIYI